MAKQKSLLKIEGTLDGMTFYRDSEGKYLVKKKSEISKSRIENDPAFIRTRENGQEFGHVATSGKIFRRAISGLTFDVRDKTMTYRLSQTLSQVKNKDATSVRGERKVAVGLATPEGKEEFKFFDFNQRAKLNSVLKTDYTLDTATPEIIIQGLVPVQNLGIPQGATHVEISAAHMMFDFETEETRLEISNVETLPIDNTSTDVALTFAQTLSGTGNEYYFLKIAWHQMLNGETYPLNNGVFNALQLIEIL